MRFFTTSFLSPVGLLALFAQKLKIFLLSSSAMASWRNFLLVYSQLAKSPFRMLSRVFIALLMLFSLMLTNFPKDFRDLVFFMFSPNAREVKALKAALFSVDPECFTTFNPSEMSDARALRVEISFCSSGYLIKPRFVSTFLVLGLLASVSITSAFFLGVDGSVSLTLSVARFFDVRFWNPSPTPEADVSSVVCSSPFCNFLSRYLRTLSLVCCRIFFLFCSSFSRESSRCFFTFSFRSVFFVSVLVRAGLFDNSPFARLRSTN